MAKFIVNKDNDMYRHEFEADSFVAGEHFVTFYKKSGQDEVSVGAIISSNVVTIHRES